MKLGAFGSKADRPPQYRLGHLQLAQRPMHIAEIGQHLRIAGVERGRPLAARQRGGKIPSFIEEEAEIGVGLSEVRLRLDCPAIAGICFLATTRGVVGVAEVPVPMDNLWIPGECPADQLDRPIRTPEFERNQAQQVQGVDIIRRLLQRLAAERLGLVQPAAPVVFCRRDNLCGGRFLSLVARRDCRRSRCCPRPAALNRNLSGSARMVRQEPLGQATPSGKAAAATQPPSPDKYRLRLGASAPTPREP